MCQIHKMASFPSSRCSQSNFQRLLQTFTPTIRSRSIPQNYVEALNKMWNPVGKPITEYFILEDLWNSFERGSACGIGTKVETYDNEDVVQYFVPKLSAIQIFTIKPPANLRIPKIEDISTTEVEAELWSDGSDGEKSSGTVSNNSSNAWEVTADDSSIDNEDSPPVNKNLRNLYFGLQESSSPYYRVPLFNKILDSAEGHPGLMTLKSTDLSPASWMAISWYPIYHIPAQEQKDDMSSAFLTFHTLSSFSQDNAKEDSGSSDVENWSGMGIKSISLPPFGLATYKLAGDIWFDCGDSDYAKLYDLRSAADSWLKQLNFDHHDFKFFNMKADHVCKVDCTCRRFGAYHNGFM